MSVNKVILVGNVGKDPEVRYLEGGTAVCSFPMATSETYRNRDGDRVTTTEWHNIVLWRGLAEIAEKYVRKGSQLFIEGKIRTRSWEDREGNKRYTTEVIADNMQMLGKRPDDASQGGGYQSGQGGTQQQAGASPQKQDGESPQKQDGASPQQQAGASPQKQDGESPQKQDGASPQQQAGEPPQNQDGESPQKQGDQSNRSTGQSEQDPAGSGPSSSDDNFNDIDSDQVDDDLPF